MGTAQDNRTGTDTIEEEKGTKKNSYKDVMWQNTTGSLCYAIWLDNNLVQTLSNFHTLNIVEGGIRRKRKVNVIQERDSATILCPQ